LSHSGHHHTYSFTRKIRSNRVRWVGYAARVKVKIIPSFGHKTLKKKSHPEDVSVESRLKDNIKVYLRELNYEAAQCFGFVQLTL